MKKIKSIIVISILALSILACQVTAGPKPPRTVTVSSDEAKALEKAIQSAEINPSTGVITMRVTESQVSSYIQFNLSKDFSEYFSNPQILFEPNQIHIYGTLQGGVFPVDGKVVSEVALVNKIPQIKIVSVDFGFIPVPSVLLSSLTDEINKTIIKNIGQSTQEYQIESIVITTGWVTLQLKKK